jgi:hypothetical protein
MTIPTPRKMDDLLFLTCFYNGSWMLRLDASKPAAATVWQSQRVSEKNTDALHSTLSTPFLQDGYIYGVCSYGQLRCLKAGHRRARLGNSQRHHPDGKEMRWANAFIVKNQDRFFLFNEKGDLIIARLTPKATRRSAGRTSSSRTIRCRPQGGLVPSRLRPSPHVRAQRPPRSSAWIWPSLEGAQATCLKKEQVDLD